MLYIHHSACLCPQHTFGQVDIDTLHLAQGNKLLVLEPPSVSNASGGMRRLGKAVKISLSAALPLLANKPVPAGIIIGTGIGGMEDSIKFLNQIKDYDEGILAPANFVQSTANAIASQIALVTKNTYCNITHVHRGLAFEHALLDTWTRAKQNPEHEYLVGAADEISAYNFNIERLAGAYKAFECSNRLLYETDTPGTLAGEGAAMFLAGCEPAGAIARIGFLRTLHSNDIQQVTGVLEDFLHDQMPQGQKVDLLLSGDSGDNRFTHYSQGCEALVGDQVSIARFKHMTGEHPSASAMALWLACHLLQSERLPSHMVKRLGRPSPGQIKNILIYNHYKGVQHSFLWVCAANA